jgi:N-acetylglucosaminyldiphosphoundecaprenol N-acetyl-beta-D-mannosaminyltransferase
MNKKNILGVGVTDASKDEILEYIVKNLENFKKKLFVVTPNPEFLVLASKNKTFRDVLNRADLALIDGVGIMIAGKMLGRPLRERFSGVDLVKSLCERVAEKPITVGFLGGRDGVAELTAECLQKKYPKLKIAFVGEEWLSGINARQSRVSDVVQLRKTEKQSLKSPSLNKSQLPSDAQLTFNSSTSGQTSSVDSVDVLFVAFGAPKQEFWINENLEKIPAKIAIGVGGAFDYLSGRTPRAPGFVRSIGFEWLFRLINQPWRIKRQLALFEFIYLIFKEKISKTKPS